MEDRRLKDTAQALWGFVPEWTPATVAAICKRIDELGTIPAVYLKAVTLNKKVPGHKLRYDNVILSKKWAEFIPQTLTLMMDEAKVDFECDLREYTFALRIRGQDKEEVLGNQDVVISDLFRNQVADMYGYKELAKKYEPGANRLMLRNPLALAPYQELRKMLR